MHARGAVGFRPRLICAKPATVAVQKRTRERVSPDPIVLAPAAPVRPNATVAEFAREWLKKREIGSRKADTQRIHDHVLPVIGTRRLRDLQTEDVTRVVRQTLAKKGMNVKSARNAHGVLHEMLGEALAQGLIAQDPRALPDDVWPEEEAASAPRFSLEEVRALTSNGRLDADQRVFNSLAFYSGLESAEICQLRFEDWQKRVSSPIAPELSGALERWQKEGFAQVYGRAPTPSDWLVPRRANVTEAHTEGSAYKNFRRACVSLKIKTRSPRAVHNTFGPPDTGAEP